jgi:hypothetical protein
MFSRAPVAQLVEQETLNLLVGGSIPSWRMFCRCYLRIEPLRAKASKNKQGDPLLAYVFADAIFLAHKINRLHSNNTISLLNFHTALWGFGNKIVNIFGPIYMLKLGISLPVVAMVWGSSYVIRFLIRPLSLLWTERIGLKKALILGTLTYAGLFPILYMIRGIDIWFWVLIFYLALSDIAYFLPYHSFYAAAGRSEDRGKQIAIRETLALFFSTSAPIVSGFLAAATGFWAVYATGIFVMFLAALPVLYTDDFKNNKIIGFKEAFQSIDKRGFWMLFYDCLFNQVEAFIWPIFVFFLAADLVQFGWLIGLEIFLSSALLLVLGNLADKGNGKKLFHIGVLGVSLVLFGRIFFVSDITGIIISQIAFAIVVVFYKAPFNMVFYNMAKQTPSTLWFHFFGEAGADAGSVILFFLTALLVHYGIGLQYVLLLAIVGIIPLTVIFDSYFDKLAASAADA